MEVLIVAAIIAAWVLVYWLLHNPGWRPGWRHVCGHVVLSRTPGQPFTCSKCGNRDNWRQVSIRQRTILSRFEVK